MDGPPALWWVLHLIDDPPPDIARDGVKEPVQVSRPASVSSFLREDFAVDIDPFAISEGSRVPLAFGNDDLTFYLLQMQFHGQFARLPEYPFDGWNELLRRLGLAGDPIPVNRGFEQLGIPLHLSLFDLHPNQRT